MKLEIRLLLILFNYLVFLCPIGAIVPPVQLKKSNQKEINAPKEELAEHPQKTLSRRELRQQRRQMRKARRRGKSRTWRSVGIVMTTLSIRFLISPIPSSIFLTLGGISLGTPGFIFIILLFIGIPLWFRNAKNPKALNDEVVSMINEAYPNLPEDVTDVAIVDKWALKTRWSRFFRFVGLILLGGSLWYFSIGLFGTILGSFSLPLTFITLVMLVAFLIGIALFRKGKELRKEILDYYEKKGRDQED
ncbi:MAG: hypothetical protein AAFP19_20765 [Bacteroidota bacterium]